MYDEFKKIIQGIIPNKNAKIAVSFSGGPDSSVLLHLAVRIYKDGFIAAPDILYFNHNLRGTESCEEEKFAKSISLEYGLKLVRISLNVRARVKEKKMTVETAARELRYHHYDKLSGIYDLILQGHHADDNAETVFFNIMRGAGLEGAGGIAQSRGKLLRPLLGFTRNEILKYAEEHGVKFVTDSSNLKTEHSRNRIRNIIFPLLEKELGRSVTERINSFSASAKEAGDFIKKAADKISKRSVRSAKGIVFISRKAFTGSDTCVKAEILRSAYKKAGFTYHPDRKTTMAVISKIEAGENKVLLNEGVSITLYKESIILINRKTFENPGKISVIDGKVTDHYFDQKKIKGSLVCDKISFSSEFTPFGKKNPEKILKVLSSKKIPPALREHLYCLKDDEKIVFIQGCGISASVATGPDTNHICSIKTSSDILKKLFNE